ncbi:MAG: hypothetical protein KKH92_02130 [Firmicutes bacterium]|nr:hypothetical protein [Bacillota bacterium]
MKKVMIKFVALGIAFILITMITISIMPTLTLRQRGMESYVGEFVQVYYEKENEAAYDVFACAELEITQLSEKLEVELDHPINIYVYDKKETFQTKKYGLFVQWIDLDWYVGDNVKDEVILTSPASDKLLFTYDSMVEITLHELVHAMNYQINPKMSLWINEGVALYLTNGNPPRYLLDYYNDTPSLKQMQTANPIAFANMGGYDFSYTYIRFIDEAYGWDYVLSLMHFMNYQEVFGKTEQAIYNEWITFLTIHYTEQAVPVND